MFQGAFEYILRKNLKNFHSSAQNLAEFSNFEFSFRVGFGAKTNIGRKQHVIYTAWCISLSRDWLSRFGFLLPHTTYVGTVMGNFLVIFYDFPPNFILGNRSHTKICFPMGNSHFHMGKIARLSAPNYEGSYSFELFKFHDFP